MDECQRPFEIGITEPADFSGHALKQLDDIGRVSVFKPGQMALTAFIADKHILFIRLKHYWGEDLLGAAVRLRYLCSPTTGLTHIDTGLAADRGVTVVSLKGETEFLKTIPATAEHTFGLALALLRRYGQAFLRPGNDARDREDYKGYELKGMRAGIIGMGRVGTMLSGYLKAFGAKTYYYDIAGDTGNPHDAERANSMISLVNAADIIFLCASYSKENENMICRDVLEQMSGKYFINTSRGEMVDEIALLQLIEKGRFAGVALDVLDGEPGDTRAGEFASLTEKHNVIITPHIAGATFSSMWATEEFITGKLLDMLKGTSENIAKYYYDGN